MLGGRTEGAALADARDVVGLVAERVNGRADGATLALGAAFRAAAGGAASLVVAAGLVTAAFAVRGLDADAVAGLGLAAGLGPFGAAIAGDTALDFFAVPDAFGVAFEADFGAILGVPFLGPADLAPAVVVFRADAVLLVMWASTARTCSASPAAGLLEAFFWAACLGILFSASL